MSRGDAQAKHESFIGRDLVTNGQARFPPGPGDLDTESRHESKHAADSIEAFSEHHTSCSHLREDPAPRSEQPAHLVSRAPKQSSQPFWRLSPEVSDSSA